MARRRRNNSSNKGKDKEDMNKKTTGTKSTDSSNPLALSSTQVITSANIGYGFPLGINAPEFGVERGNLFNDASNIPSLAVYWLYPTAGVSQDNGSALNLAAHRLYTSFVYANGRSPSYDVPDALITPLAVGQVGMMYNFAARAYRILNTFPSMNRSLPRAMFAGIGLDYDDFKTHLADFSFWMENFRIKLASLFIPNNLPIMNEWMDTMTDIYVDTPDNNKAQLYLFAPAHVLKYEPTKYTTGGSLIPKNYLTLDSSGIPTVMTYAQFVAFCDDLVDALIYDQDVNKIMADIMLSYGPTSLQDVAAVAIGEPIIPKYDMTVLATIHNCTVMGYGVLPATYTGHSTGTNSFEIFQDANGNLIHEPYWSGAKYHATGPVGSWRLDSPIVDPNPLLNLAMTRMTVLAPAVDLTAQPTLGSNPGIYLNTGNSNCYVKPSSTGCFVVGRVFIIKASSAAVGFDQIPLDSCWFTNQSTAMVSEIQIGLEKFDMHHLIPIMTVNAAGVTSVNSLQDLTFNGYFGDAYYYTLLDSVNLDKMHLAYDLALLSAGYSGS